MMNDKNVSYMFILHEGNKEMSPLMLSNYKERQKPLRKEYDYDGRSNELRVL